uniref:Uncharacterized protein n=1 Tax=Mimivirus LCMiAC01 TaxID=2506608 RepID=A0A481Z018_9VIRU|nr:MAG: hypothetical protein LCMiAC01_04410 [Mimivirus LCMiAC01]
MNFDDDYEIKKIKITGRKRKRQDASTRPHKKRKIDQSTIKFDLKKNEQIWDNFNKYYKPRNIPIYKWKIDWVSPTAIKNCMMNDPCLDWIHLYYNYRKNNKFHDVEREKNQLSILFKMGNKFEDNVMDYIRLKYPNHIKKVVQRYVDIHSKNKNIVINYMKAGVPFIEQALLYNNKNHTFGVADLIVRSDWINKLFNRKILSDNETTRKAPNLNGNYHYVTIDVKWTTLPLCSNGTNIRNSNMFPAYKGQLAIYNAAVGNIQGYTPSKAYILAKSWQYTSKKVTYNGYNCFDLLGVIDYENNDNHYLEKTWYAIKWVRNVRYNGHKWKCNPPSVPELYPNMCNKYDSPYHKIKEKIADEERELTQIWRIGIKNRQQAHKNGIFKWSDSSCTSENIGIKGKKIGPVINKILNINRSKINIILPNIIRNNMYGWQTKKDIEFWVDYETVSGCFYDETIKLNDSRKKNLTFMIGVGYEDNNQWNYKVFHIKTYDIIEEKKMVNDFINFINQKVKEHMTKYGIKSKALCNPSIFHWGHAERTIFNSMNRHHGGIWNDWKDSVRWIDMCDVFQTEPIVIKDVKKFGLKDVARGMYNHGFIKTIWSDNLADGLGAMMQAIKYYKFMDIYNYSRDKTQLSQSYIEHTNKFNEIIQYNEVDCKVLWDIVKYLREHHC